MKMPSIVLKGEQVAVLVPGLVSSTLKIYEDDKTEEGTYVPPKFLWVEDAVGLQQFLNEHIPGEFQRLANIEQGIRDFIFDPHVSSAPTAAELIAWLESTTGFVLEPPAERPALANRPRYDEGGVIT